MSRVTPERLADSPPSSVFFVIGSFEVGGAEHQLALLARELATRGCNVSVFALDGQGPLREAIQSHAVVIDGGYDMGRARLVKSFQLLRAQVRLIGRLRRARPQVLHAYLPLTNFMGALAGRLTGVPCIVTSKRGIAAHQDRHPWWRPLDRLANRLSDVVTANSATVAADTARRDGLPASRIVTIRNGLDTSVFHPRREARDAVRQELRLAPTDIAVVCLANLTRPKGHVDLVEAFAPLARSDGRLRLFLLGQNREASPDVDRAIARLGLERNVVRLGLRRDVARVLAGMDIAVQPSHHEGASNAVLEVLACGLPLIATPVGDNLAVMADLPGGRLVPVRDVYALTAALRDFVAELPSLQRSAAARSAVVSERHSPGALAAAHLQAYRSVLAQRS